LPRQPRGIFEPVYCSTFEKELTKEKHTGRIWIIHHNKHKVAQNEFWSQVHGILVENLKPNKEKHPMVTTLTKDKIAFMWSKHTGLEMDNYIGFG